MSWNTTKTGNLYHDFSADGTAVCGTRGTEGYALAFETLEAAQERVATWRVGSLRNNVKVCGKCEAREMAARERLAASLEPSTGEGDYLSPAEEACCEHVGMCHGAQGCDLCQCTTARSDMAKVAETAKVAAQGMAKVSAEVIRALATIRAFAQGERRDVSHEINVLDNAGVFAAIDEATGYDVDPEPCTCPELSHRTGIHVHGCPERPVSKCVCPDELGSLHRAGCPGEWGDMAYIQVGSDEWHRQMGQALAETPLYAHRVETPAPYRSPCPADGCTLSFRVNKDGTLHKHLNDNLLPCPGTAPNPKENNCE
jgi:hypothetical protein